MTNVELYISRNQTFGHDSHLWCTSSFSLSPSLPFFTLCYKSSCSSVLFLSPTSHILSVAYFSYHCKIFNDTLPWQPIPVHTLPVEDDNVMLCPHIFLWRNFILTWEVFLHRCRCCTPTQTVQPMRNFSKKTRSHRATVTWTRKMKYVCVGTCISFVAFWVRK